MKRSKHLIREFTEFNLQRMNSDSVQPSVHVDDPKLSIGAFDKHEDLVRQAISKIGTLSKSLQSDNAFRYLKSKLSLDDQDITNLKILRIVKSTNLNYDVYLKFKISEDEYWGVVKDVLGNPEFKSEVFKDGDLVQTKEWVIKTKGIIIKAIKSWLKPQFGKFKLIGSDINCFSSETGKLLTLPTGSEIEVLKSYDNKIIFEYNGNQYSLTGDNFIFFNWWFEEVIPY